MSTMLFPAAALAVEPLLAVGNRQMAEDLIHTTDVGSALLKIEALYGDGVANEDYYNASLRLEAVRGQFRERRTEMSHPIIGTHQLSLFFERASLFPTTDGTCPALLSDLLLQRRRRLMAGDDSSALLGLMAHLSGGIGLKLQLATGPEDRPGLWAAAEGTFLTFHGRRAEIMMMSEAPGARPIHALLALHLETVARTHGDPDYAARLASAAQALYPR